MGPELRWSVVLRSGSDDVQSLDLRTAEGARYAGADGEPREAEGYLGGEAEQRCPGCAHTGRAGIGGREKAGTAFQTARREYGTNSLNYCQVAVEYTRMDAETESRV